jgi:hypothetical protein
LICNTQVLTFLVAFHSWAKSVSGYFRDDLFPVTSTAGLDLAALTSSGLFNPVLPCTLVPLLFTHSHAKKCIHMHTNKYLYAHTHSYTHTHINTHTHTHTHVHTHMHKCTHTYTHTQCSRRAARPR